MSQELIPKQDLFAIIIKTDDNISGCNDYEYRFMPVEKMQKFVNEDMKNSFVSLWNNRVIPTWRIYDVRIMDSSEPEIVLAALSPNQRKSVTDFLKRRYETWKTRPKDANHMANIVQKLLDDKKI